MWVIQTIFIRSGSCQTHVIRLKAAGLDSNNITGYMIAVLGHLFGNGNGVANANPNWEYHTMMCYFCRWSTISRFCCTFHGYVRYVMKPMQENIVIVHTRQKNLRDCVQYANTDLRIKLLVKQIVNVWGAQFPYCKLITYSINWPLRSMMLCHARQDR